MRVRSSIKDTDKGYQKLRRELSIKGSKVEVGVFQQAGGATYGNQGVSVLDVAIWQEFGTIGANGWHIPPRPFIRTYFDGQQPRITGIVLSTMKGVVKGQYTKTQALHRIGLKLSGEIQQGIKVGFFGAYPENAQNTIDRKGSSTPLVDTGQLRSSISYKVKLR
jgi:hypothetical protein